MSRGQLEADNEGEYTRHRLLGGHCRLEVETCLGHSKLFKAAHERGPEFGSQNSYPMSSSGLCRHLHVRDIRLCTYTYIN